MFIGQKIMKKIITILFVGLISLSSQAAFANQQAPVVAGWIKAYEKFDLEAFLEYYTDNTHFVDPTAQINFTSRKQLASTYTGIMQGRYGGNFRFDVKRMVTQGNDVVIEGLFSLTWNGQEATINFTTWLTFEGGKISRQLDMFDYNHLQRQIPTYGQGVPSEYTPE